MGTLDDVASMRREGRTDNEVVSYLKQRGLSDSEVSTVMTQTKIKDAVSGVEMDENTLPGNSQAPMPVQEAQDSDMSPSLMSSSSGSPQQVQQAPEQQYSQDDSQQVYSDAPQAYSDYGYQQQYAPQGLGSDVISEIADQVVTEKLSPVISSMDKILDMKSSMDAQLRLLDERMKRIEKIIDRLQLSLLQRVGEYVSNVEDIKREMEETNKTFRSLSANR